MEQIVTTVEETREHVPIHRYLDFSTLKPYVEQATEELNEKLLGEAEYNRLYTAYNANLFDGGMAQSDLLKLCQRFIANYALLKAIPHLRNHVSELGIQQSFEDSGNVSRPATDKSVATLLHAYAENAYRESERILAHLERYQDTFYHWRNSDLFVELNQGFIRNVGEMREFLPVVKSRQTFLSLRPFILTLNTELEASFGEEFVNDVLKFKFETLRNRDLSTFPNAYALILPKFMAYVAYKSLLNAIPFMEVRLEEDALRVDRYERESATISGADYRRVEQLTTQLKSLAKQAEETLKQHLIKNADDYPKFSNSAAYTELNPETRDNLNQLESSSFWI